MRWKWKNPWNEFSFSSSNVACSPARSKGNLCLERRLAECEIKNRYRCNRRSEHLTGKGEWTFECWRSRTFVRSVWKIKRSEGNFASRQRKHLQLRSERKSEWKIFFPKRYRCHCCCRSCEIPHRIQEKFLITRCHEHGTKILCIWRAQAF